MFAMHKSPQSMSLNKITALVLLFYQLAKLNATLKVLPIVTPAPLWGI